MASYNRFYKILSIDGGGIRGIIPAAILKEIERRTNKRIYQLFDLIAGTSTGGILALGLTTPREFNKNGNYALYSAEDLLNLYINQGADIFAKSRTLPSFIPDQLASLFCPKYRDTGRDNILHSYFKDAFLVDALTKIFITSYDTVGRVPVFFTNDVEQIGVSYKKLFKGITMRQAAIATSAAPTFFPPFELADLSLVDGGVYANNPVHLAITESIINSKGRETRTLDDLMVVSLGTGSLTRPYPYNKTKNWGALQWVGPLIDVAFDAQSEAIASQLEQMFPSDRYYRFQALLTTADDDMDNTSPRNISDLLEVADQLIISQDKNIDRLCQNLIS